MAIKSVTNIKPNNGVYAATRLELDNTKLPSIPVEPMAEGYTTNLLWERFHTLITAVAPGYFEDHSFKSGDLAPYFI